VSDRQRRVTRIATVAVAVVLVAAWKGYVELFGVSPLLLPAPESVARAAGDLLGQGSTLHHTTVTLYEIVVGFGIAVGAGVVIGIVLGRMPAVERTVNPYLVALQVTPKVALIPMLALWLGFGSASKVVVAAIFALLPLVMATIAGVRSIDANHRDLLASLGASRWDTFRLLDLPSALPSVLTGMEVGVVLATTGAIVGEFLGGNQGLGYLAVRSLNQLNVARLFAIILLLCVLGYVLFMAVSMLRRSLVPWHESVTVLQQ